MLCFWLFCVHNIVTRKRILANGFKEGLRDYTLSTERVQKETCLLELMRLTFPLEALPAEKTDDGEELGDLLQVHDCGVVQVDDGHGLFVVR